MKRLERMGMTFWWFVLRKFPYVTYQSHVGNRTIRRGMLGMLEVTITFRDTRESDGYSREELLRMLQLIRVNEERQNWKTPEPVRCGGCGHVTPSVEGNCPVVKSLPRSKTKLQCLCQGHDEGLQHAMREALNRSLQKEPAI